MISTIILTYNEEVHLQRCLDSVSSISDDIIVVDSGSSDDTKKICHLNTVKFYQRKFINQSETLNWALENISFKHKKILRLDADEYISSESIEFVKSGKLQVNLEDCDALLVKRSIIFMGKRLKYGGISQRSVVRILDVDSCRYDTAEMDERVITSGKVCNSGLTIIDHNLNDIEYFIVKHLAYAKRESRKNYSSYVSENYSKTDQRMLNLKKIYSKYNCAFLAVLYFIYRYLLLLGFLDGRAGFYYHFYQALFYRLTVLTVANANQK